MCKNVQKWSGGRSTNIANQQKLMPPTPKSAKMSGCCWELLLGGTTFEIRHLYLCTKKFGASNLSQFWRLKALFIIILALNALFIVSFGFVLSVLAPKALCIVFITLT